MLLGTCTAFFALIKRHAGPLPALIASVILLVFGSDWGHVGTSLGFTVLSSIGAGLVAILLIERKESRSDVGACFMLALSIASFSTGLAFAVGIAVYVLLSPNWRRRTWVFAVPLALYVAWWVWARGNESSAVSPELTNLLSMPNYAFVSLGAVLSSLTGFNYDFSVTGAPTITLGPGPVFAALALVAVVVRIARGRLPPIVWAALATLICYWSLGALVTNHGGVRSPLKTRYMFPGAVMVLFTAAVLIGRSRSTRPMALAVLGLAATGLLVNLALLYDGAAWFRNDFSAPARAQFTMLDLSRGRVADDYDPGLVPDNPVINSPAGAYLRAAAEFGSPGFEIGELESQPNGVRTTADEVLADALGLGLDPLGGQDGSNHCPAGSRPIDPSSAEIPAGSELLIGGGAPSSVTVGRFADQPSVQVGDVAAGQWARLSIPADDAERGWHVQLGGTPAALLCLDGQRPSRVPAT